MLLSGPRNILKSKNPLILGWNLIFLDFRIFGLMILCFTKVIGSNLKVRLGPIFQFVDNCFFCKVVFSKFWFSSREHINVVSLSSKLLNFKKWDDFEFSWWTSQWVGREEKITKELNTKQKQSGMEGMVKENNQTRSLGRNGKWEKKKVTWMECKMHVTWMI